MKVTLKGNTAKTKKFFPATEDKPAMLYVDIAEKVKKHDGSELTIWHHLKVARGYAETIYKGLHGEKPVSRFIQVEGRIVNPPTANVVNSQMSVFNTIWVDEVTWLDDKRPDNESGIVDEAGLEETEAPVEVAEAEEMPW